MADVKILTFVESRYKVNRKKIKQAIHEVLDEHKITSSCEVSLAFVGDRKMRSLNKKFRNMLDATAIRVLLFSTFVPAKKVPRPRD